MKVLIACEESQTTCTAFREAGHEAYSCDMVECSGGHPEWHIQGDCMQVINGDCVFVTQDCMSHVIEGTWDLVIAHPPCTYLSNVATRAYSLRVTPADKVVERWQNRAKAAVFFMQIALCNAKRLAVENPIGFMNGAWRKPDQIIQPYYFAESADDIENYQLKTTCLWLRDLPLLHRTNDLPKPAPVYVRECADGTKKNVYFEENHGKIGDSKHKKNDMAARSKTFSGVSRAMVEQWGVFGMNILIACEESQTVCKAFRDRGHTAFSCDIQDCSGGHPEWHIHGDCLPLLNGDCTFSTQDGETHHLYGRWDMIIAHPPCTDLSVSGSKYFAQKRADGRQRASIEFFCRFMEADCNRVAIENPVNIIGGHYIEEWFPDLCDRYGLPRKYTQMIQPYEYGHPESKRTCLWLKGLPPLQPTKVLPLPACGHWANQTADGQNKLIIDGHWIGYNDPRTAKARSVTYKGIAEAMAAQWGGDDAE